MKIPKYAFHPICLLFPPMTDEELQEFAEDIRLKGLLHPILLYEGKILDGRNRYLACIIAGVMPRFVEWKGKGSPVEWVISENMIRRHLTSSQRAVIALDLLPLLEKDAHERRRLSPGRGKKIRQKCRIFSETSHGESRKIAATMAKTSSTYVQSVKAIQRQAPELLDKIRSGTIKVPDATRLARLPPKERQGVSRHLNGHPLKSRDLLDLTKQVKNEFRHRAAKAFAKRSRPSDNGGILIGDLGLLEDRLEDNSVDLFLTDPPYAEVDLYARLAELAAAKLKPGGLCVAYSGHYYLPTVMSAMGEHLSYWWMFALEFAGKPRAIHPRRIQNQWRPILAFGKPPLKKAPDGLSDLLRGGGRDKSFHDWGQDASEMSYLISRLTQPGQLVVDPFCGGGQIPAACKATGRRWLATEKDKATAMVARMRLSGKPAKVG